ncbi:hypothetical protein J6590_029949 [Homalodisca vitripennis]|nr:hypothetical protein J6590_029949 [Homalodisca vitripennis]
MRKNSWSKRKNAVRGKSNLDGKIITWPVASYGTLRIARTSDGSAHRHRAPRKAHRAGAPAALWPAAVRSCCELIGVCTKRNGRQCRWQCTRSRHVAHKMPQSRDRVLMSWHHGPGTSGLGSAASLPSSCSGDYFKINCIYLEIEQFGGCSTYSKQLENAPTSFDKPSVRVVSR